MKKCFYIQESRGKKSAFFTFMYSRALYTILPFFKFHKLSGSKGMALYFILFFFTSTRIAV